jgi:hypothetical protein
MEVKLPWHPTGHPITKLKRRSAAVCDWIVPIQSEDVQSVSGQVPVRLLIQILERVNRFLNP